jgi:hypothetical protein
MINWREELERALLNLDVEWAKSKISFPTNPVDDETVLCSLHKSRYESTRIPDEPRHESARWLRERGYGRLGGLPLLPEGELPDQRCPVCNGNDADLPCAYPWERVPGCLRDKRTEKFMKQFKEINWPVDNVKVSLDASKIVSEALTLFVKDLTLEFGHLADYSIHPKRSDETLGVVLVEKEDAKIFRGDQTYLRISLADLIKRRLEDLSPGAPSRDEILDQLQRIIDQLRKP